jgi:hypothetical protein
MVVPLLVTGRVVAMEEVTVEVELRIQHQHREIMGMLVKVLEPMVTIMEHRPIR